MKGITGNNAELNSDYSPQYLNNPSLVKHTIQGGHLFIIKTDSAIPRSYYLTGDDIVPESLLKHLQKGQS